MGCHSSLSYSCLAKDLQIRVGRSQKAIRIGICAGLLAAGILLATSHSTPMVWDEGDAILRAERVRAWFGDLFRVEVKGPPPLSQEGLARGWPFTVQREGHPALYGVIIALGRGLAPGFLDPLTRYRFGPLILFSLATGMIVYRVSRIGGPIAAVATFLCVFLQPRLFSHAHFASFDGPVTAWWMLAWACCPYISTQESFLKRTPRRNLATILAWGVILGAAMSSKSTGWFVMIPFLLWAIVMRNLRTLSRVVLGTLVGFGAFVMFNPPLWEDPLGGILRFFQLNLGRHERADLNITTYFLGRLYNLDYPLPWYNTLFWTAIAVPVPILVFFVAGLVYSLRSSKRRVLILIVLHWITLVIVRAIPGTPPHDGIRLFLPAFPFLGILAGFGLRFTRVAFAVQLRRWGRRLPLTLGNRRDPTKESVSQQRKHHGWPGWRPRRAAAVWHILLWAFVLSPAFNLICFGPQWLSYYNTLIGGLPGAATAGMEPTYYWDGLDREVFMWLEIHCLETEKVYYSACPWSNLRLLQQWGVLKRGFATSPADAQWYVVQNRPGAWFPEDRWLFTQGEAAFIKYPGKGPSCPWVGRVPIVKVFPIREYFRACRAVSMNTEASD